MLKDGTLFASHSFFLRAGTHALLELPKVRGTITNYAAIQKALAKAEKQSPYNLYLK